MSNIAEKKRSWISSMLTFIGTITILLGMNSRIDNCIYVGFIIIGMAVVLYFLMTLLAYKKNWLDIRAVFTGVWLFTIGLATLHLADYQEQWMNKTWILLALGYLLFQIGASLGEKSSDILCEKIKYCMQERDVRKYRFVLHKERLFPICIIVTVLGIACFVINIKIRGFIPAFSNDINAYHNFYTKFHVFSVAATSVSGLCYYCIKQLNISKIKKVCLWICIFYLVVLFPILVVSRGVFIIAAISFTTTVFYLNKKRLIVFIGCLIAILSVYLFTSLLRGYTDEQLNVMFEPSNIVLENADSQKNEVPQDDINQEEVQEQEGSPTKEDEKEQDVLDKNNPIEEELDTKNYFVLPPKLAFLYGYLTVSHDNFNEAVKYTEGYTWGARQLYPFNVILRISAITKLIDQGEYYQVNPYLNTVNMIGLFYYDFHEWGVIVCTFLWALIFGLIQGIQRIIKGPFSLFILSFIMNAVMLSFFSSWVDSFELWMFCGTMLLIAIIANIEKNKM